MHKTLYAGFAVLLTITTSHADEVRPLDLPIFDELDRIVVTATLDLYAHWQPLPRLELFGALTNLGGRRYWSWGSVDGFIESRAIDLYSATGRAVRVGLRATF